MSLKKKRRGNNLLHWTTLKFSNKKNIQNGGVLKGRDPGIVVRTPIHFWNPNMNPNKGGEFVSFYLEYEYEFELTRVCYCVYMCIPV